jgi:hypothetical protein
LVYLHRRKSPVQIPDVLSCLALTFLKTDRFLRDAG